MSLPLNQRFSDPVLSVEELRDTLPPPSPIARDKVIDHIDGFCRQFIERSPFLVIGSRGQSGELDLSPKGDPCGFVKIIDEQTLAIPDRLGNNRADTFQNIFSNPEVGLIFLVPGKQETLRVSGRGLLVRDEELRQQLAHNGRPPNLVLVVEVRHVLFHCSKCMIRSGLWDPKRWPDVSDVASLAEAIKVHSQLKEPVEAIDDIIAKSATDRLY